MKVNIQIEKNRSRYNFRYSPPTESDEENVMYSICTYIADNDEAINLVEGEKVHVIARHSAEWWYVKKHLTEEQGWVPSQYLMDSVNYQRYVEKKLHEKIDKLPVFESKYNSETLVICPVNV